jgi:arylsulfatase A-like enzyme
MHIRQLNFVTIMATACICMMLLVTGCAQQTANTVDHRPNIIVILVDDMGYSDLGSYGSEIQTPNLDRMAAEGVRFTQFYNTARCCPTRAALLTGLYQHQAGIGYMVADRGYPAYQGRLNDQCVTIAEALQPAGYRTLMSGKWHVGDDRGHWPLDRGFERYWGLINGASSFWELDEGLDMALDNESWTPEGDDFYMTDATTDYAVQFIDETKSDDKPFFLYLAYTAPHYPLHAWPEDIEKYRGKYMEGWDALRETRLERMREMGIVDPAWALSPLDEKVPGQRIKRDGTWEEQENKEEWDLLMAVYAAMVDRMDQGVGRVIDKLEAMGIDDNTLVMFMSDNGACAFRNNKTPDIPPGPKGSFHGTGTPWAQASDTPFRRFKQWTHEGGISTPMIAWWPEGIAKPGRLNHTPGHVIDIMATCLDVAGVEYPAEYQGNAITLLEGTSLAPLLEGRESLAERPIYWEHMGSRALRLGNWKLVMQREVKEWELYNMKTDRTELHDLIDMEPARANEMITMWKTWEQKVGAQPWPIK